jgi:hypothetical protein
MVCSFAGSNTYNPANFTTTLNVMRKPNSYSISEIEAAAQTVKSYVAKNKKLPSTVKVGPKKLKISEFAYLASKAIANLNANNKNDIVLLKNIKNCKSSTVSLKTKVLRAQYVTIAKNVAKAIKNKKVPPTATAVKNNRKRTVGKASFNLYTFEFAKILVYHKKNDVLAKSCTFSTDVFKKTSAQKATVLKGSNNTLVRGTNYVLTLTDSNGKVLKGQKLSYFVNGKTYTLTTDAKGSTYLQINLKEGKYTMVCSFAGTKTYKAAKKTVLLTVLKKTNSVSVSAVERAAANVKAYVNANKQLPSYSNSG